MAPKYPILNLDRKKLAPIADNQRTIEPFLVVARGITRHYGGPQEGGWWYDASTVHEVRKVWGWRAGLAAIRELKEEHPTCPRGRHSVAGRADMDIVLLRDDEQLADLEWPEQRPTYE